MYVDRLAPHLKSADSLGLSNRNWAGLLAQTDIDPANPNGPSLETIPDNAALFAYANRIGANRAVKTE